MCHYSLIISLLETSLYYKNYHDIGAPVDRYVSSVKSCFSSRPALPSFFTSFRVSGLKHENLIMIKYYIS